MEIGYRTVLLFHFVRADDQYDCHGRLKRVIFDVYDSSNRLVSTMHEMKNIEYYVTNHISFDLVFKSRYNCTSETQNGMIKFHSDNKAKVYCDDVEAALMLPKEFDLIVNYCDINVDNEFSTNIKGIIISKENDNVQNKIKEELNKKYGFFRPKYKAIYGLLNEKEKDNMNNYYFGIKDIKFHGVATIVFWKDGTKTVVKCHEDEKEFDVEKAIMAAFMKRALESKTGTQKDKSMDRILGEYTAKYEKELEMNNLKKPSAKKPRKKK